MNQQPDRMEALVVLETQQQQYHKDKARCSSHSLSGLHLLLSEHTDDSGWMPFMGPVMEKYSSLLLDCCSLLGMLIVPLSLLCWWN